MPGGKDLVHGGGSSSQASSPTSVAGAKEQAGAHSPVSFLTIAPELRNEIYKLVLCKTRCFRHPTWLFINCTPALLLVNKIVHAEAISVLYGQNTFLFQDGWDDVISRFIAMIGSHNAARIRHVVVELEEDLTHEGKPIFADPVIFGIIQRNFVNLRTLTLDCNHPMRLIAGDLFAPHSCRCTPKRRDGHALEEEQAEVVDRYLRGMPCLERFTATVSANDLCFVIEEMMERRGWNVDRYSLSSFPSTADPSRPSSTVDDLTLNQGSQADVDAQSGIGM